MIHLTLATRPDRQFASNLVESNLVDSKNSEASFKPLRQPGGDR